MSALSYKNAINLLVLKARIETVYNNLLEVSQDEVLSCFSSSAIINLVSISIAAHTTVIRSPWGLLDPLVSFWLLGCGSIVCLDAS